MRERTCHHCGETVYLAEQGETVVRGQTPLEHFRKTGHAWNEPEMRACDDCENVWPYGGDSDRPTCPACKGKRTEPVAG